eukprot:7785618-Alexandrium_andersonii.AAC.1
MLSAATSQRTLGRCKQGQATLTASQFGQGGSRCGWRVPPCQPLQLDTSSGLAQASIFILALGRLPEN